MYLDGGASVWPTRCLDLVDKKLTQHNKRRTTSGCRLEGTDEADFHGQVTTQFCFVVDLLLLISSFFFFDKKKERIESPLESTPARKSTRPNPTRKKSACPRSDPSVITAWLANLDWCCNTKESAHACKKSTTEPSI